MRELYHGPVPSNAIRLNGDPFVATSLKTKTPASPITTFATEGPPPRRPLLRRIFAAAPLPIRPSTLLAPLTPLSIPPSASSRRVEQPLAINAIRVSSVLADIPVLPTTFARVDTSNQAARDAKTITGMGVADSKLDEQPSCSRVIADPSSDEDDDTYYHPRVVPFSLDDDDDLSVKARGVATQSDGDAHDDDGGDDGSFTPSSTPASSAPVTPQVYAADALPASIVTRSPDEAKLVDLGMHNKALDHGVGIHELASLDCSLVALVL